MNIRDAALKAQKLGRGIARKSDGPRPTIFICTNLTKGIFVKKRQKRCTKLGGGEMM